jgi:hypothetical protein
MDRRYEIMSDIRSLACYQPGTLLGWKREQGMALLEELEAALDKLDKLRGELRRLADEA